MKKIVFKAFDQKKKYYVEENIFFSEVELFESLRKKDHILIRIIKKHKIKKIKKERIILMFETVGKMLKSGIGLKKAFEYMNSSKLKEERFYLKKICESLDYGENILDILEKMELIKKKRSI